MSVVQMAQRMVGHWEFLLAVEKVENSVVQWASLKVLMLVDDSVDLMAVLRVY